MSRTFHHHRRERYRKEPNWWFHEFAEVRIRAKTRVILTEAVRSSKESLIEVMIPHPKKIIRGYY